jgi:ABC-2 type transport system ATP-binding protein
MGSVATFIAKGDREAVVAELRGKDPIILDVLPLNLEEVFVYEMEALGYAFKDVLM